METIDSTDKWQHELSEVVEFRRVKADQLSVGAAPFGDVVRYFHGGKNLPLQTLDRVVGVPIFSKDGKLKTSKGYDPDTRCYIDPQLKPLDVSPNPSNKEVEKAKSLLLDDALVDFPFSDAFSGDEAEPHYIDKKLHHINPRRGASSRVNALAMLLQPFVRDMIDGPTPAYHIDKSLPGTGAGLLADVCSIISDGRRAAPKPVSTSDEELRKSIGAALLNYSSIIFLDNVKYKVSSALTLMGPLSPLGRANVSEKLPLIVSSLQNSSFCKRLKMLARQMG